jgi:uncharacterized zinc-type alcohol dehydrogenase-like protein
VAVKIAHAMGATVAVLSQSLGKQADGLAFGADHYYATSDPDTFDKLAGSFDLMLNTVAAQLPLDSYLGVLKADGVFVTVGFPAGPLQFRAGSVLARQRRIVGSNVGGLEMTQEMPEFCAGHGIAAEIELIGTDRIAEAYRRIPRSQVRYRFVLDIAETLIDTQS